MSGKKRITVDEGAWLDAQRKAAQLRDVQRELPAMLEAVRAAQQAQAERDAAELGARQDELARALAGLSSRALALEESTTERLQAATETIMSEVRQSAATSRRLLGEQEQRFTTELAQERDERRQQLAGLREDLEGMRADRDRTAAAAAAAVTDAQLLHDGIAAALPHERFAPGELAALGRRLALARDNADRGMAEAALAQAQDLYLQLGDLRVAIELRDAQWRAAHLAAGSAVAALTGQITCNAVLDVSEDGVAAELDVDFWTGGELASIRAEAQALAQRVAAESGPLSAGQLRELAESEVPALDSRLTAAVATARSRQWASQLRVNLAELVTGALEDSTGYCWEGEATYAGQDERGAFYAKLRHLDDSEIIVEVAPDGSGESCVLRILSYESGEPDEAERARRVQAIADRLREQGLRAGDPAAEAGAPDPALTDFARLREPRPQAWQRGLP